MSIERKIRIKLHRRPLQRLPKLSPEEIDQLNAPYKDILNNISALPKPKAVSVEEAAESHDAIFNNNQKKYLRDLSRPH